MARSRLTVGGAVAVLLGLAVVALLVVRDGEAGGQLTAAGPFPITTVTSALTPPPPVTAVTTLPAPTTSVAPRPTTTSLRASTTTDAPAAGTLTTTAGAHGPMQAALTAARQRWTAGRPAQGYVWIYERACRCSPRKVEATVDAAGSVLSARSLDRGATGEPVVGALTVDVALADLQKAIDTNAASISARFDPVLGLPLASSIDRSTSLADEQQAFSVSAFSPRPVR